MAAKTIGLSFIQFPILAARPDLHPARDTGIGGRLPLIRQCLAITSKNAIFVPVSKKLITA
jgi:hypothetical protein